MDFAIAGARMDAYVLPELPRPDAWSPEDPEAAFDAHFEPRAGRRACPDAGFHAMLLHRSLGRLVTRP